MNDEIIVKLNMELSNMGCVFRYKLISDIKFGNTVELILPNVNNIESYTINLTSEFIDWLVSWFKAMNINIAFNNTKNVFWEIDN